YKASSGPPEYRVLVARSKTVNGNYSPNNSMQPILEGKDPIRYPGHHPIVTDGSNTDWIVYHGYYKGEKTTRTLNVDKISFDGEWPVVNSGNGPSSSQQSGTPTDASTPAATDSSSNCVCTSAPGTTLTGSTEAEQAFNFFLSKGYSPQQTAGIVGNMKAESGVLPMRKQSTEASVKTSSKDVQDSSSGWGIVQWTPPSKMINPSLAAKKKYAEIDTLEYQLQFLWEQLEGTGIGGEISEKAAGDDLKKQTTIDGSARSFMLKFERPKDQSESAQKGRVQLANEIFGLYGTGEATTTPTGSSATPGGGCVSAGGGGDIVSIAQAELQKGVKEDPLGCDAGNPSSKGSCGPEVDKYTDGTLEYWCADFVSWVYKQAGTPFTGGASGGWRIPSVSSVQKWFEENGVWVMNGKGVIPKPGDVYTMGISHSGIVEKVEGDTVYTISGNTATDNTGNGNGVGRGSYQVGSSEIIGYGSLK
ncbi:MAG: phage tail tip lysozyme, partial [Candidatus Saccharimonadales bacterium]